MLQKKLTLKSQFKKKKLTIGNMWKQLEQYHSYKLKIASYNY
jgi:hypothetical protein